MLSVTDYQNAYQKFYIQLRKYIWDFNVVELLAEFETALYDAFSDKDKIKATFYKLNKEIKDVCEDDEEFKEAVDAMRDLVEKEEEQYLSLYKVTEAIHDEDKEKH